MQKIHLTDDVVRSLPFTALDGRRVHFADATVENMRLVVGGGRKAFYFVPDLPGISGILRIGGYPETATERAREIAARLKRAFDPRQIEISSSNGLEQPAPFRTFAAVLELHIQQLHMRSHNRSADKDAKLLRRYLMDTSMNPSALKPIGLVTDADVLELIMSMRDRPALARNCLSKLKTFFKWAMKPGRRSEFGLAANPVSDITARMLELHPRWRDRHFSELEMRAYLAAMDRLENPSQRIYCQVLVLTGQRPGDLGMMRWSDLDLDRKFWNKPLHRDDIYGRTAGIMPLSDVTVSLLESLRCNTPSSVDDHVFGSAFASPGKLSRLRRIVDRHMMDHMHGAGLKPWRWQDLRRSVFNILVEAGAPFEVARCTIGSGTLPIYASPPLRPIREALERLALALEDIRRNAGPNDEGSASHRPE